MSEKEVLIQKRGKVCTLVMNRPKVLNALNLELIQGLQEALDTVALDKAISVVVLEGAGGNFSSGADMALFLEDLSATAWLDGMKLFGRLIRSMREIPQPVITKVRGAAVGGGINLALAGDFVLASDDARFRENFVHIGAVLDGGGTYFLPRLVGLAKARQLAFLGDFFDGTAAASMGLIYKSLPDGDLDREVNALAETLSQRSLQVMALIKEGLEGSLDMSLKEVLEWEAAHQSIVLQAPEHKEAIREFVNSRAKS